MLENYKTIKFSKLDTQPQPIAPDRGYKELDLEDSAISVMTDHRLEKAPICTTQASLESASKQMAKEKTSMLLVENKEGQIVGLISSADISGEKPIQFINETKKKRSEIKVGHLMSDIVNMPVLDIQDVLNAKIGDVLFTLNDLGSEYILVTTKNGHETNIRGVFSARHIARSLNIFFKPSPAAKTFAEYSRALSESHQTH
ncbi:CBS domain-containing protein [Bermanella sp. WJH001]|uniref:CBS domain-containing protein n=1 Tax=Bermanella sp. WJH001 TaxID=3048005 RepID=UPI0024BEF9E2|nr:CBS domain-containing protein [Bermanella sp. WJH001]MDJ1536978.1 CBS domain-containing protein [Bermanella sp. WJH001]